MSRSNTFYYTICYPSPHYYPWSESNWYVDEDGICSDCRGYNRRRGGADKRCIVEKDIQTRRGIWKRRRRFSRGWKTWHRGPDAGWKQTWHKKARRIQEREFRKNPDDPMITPMKRLIDLWDWY